MQRLSENCWPEIPVSELARVVAAVRGGTAVAVRDRWPRRRSEVVFFASILIFLHAAFTAASSMLPTGLGPHEDVPMIGMSFAARSAVRFSAAVAPLAPLAVLSAPGVASAQNAVEWRVADGGNGHWYELVISSSRQTWQVSRDSANASGGHLATVVTAAEDVFIRSWLPPYTDESGGQAWLGAYQDRSVPDYSEPFGGWRWVTGEAMGYQAWSHGGSEANYPGADFLALAHREFEPGYFWNDMQTDYFGGRFFSIVEYSADCNQDGIVDYGQIRAGELVDANANNIPDCCEQPVPCTPCQADVDESGAVNSVDLAAVLANWGTDGGKYPRADVNGDGTINSSDLAAVLSEWGPCQ